MPIGYSRNNLAQKISRLQGNTQAKLGDQYNQLSSGLRINRPSADPAGLAVSSKLAAESRISNRARLNVDDGISVANSADGAYEAASGVLARMSELAGQSASGVLTTSQRSALSAEFDALQSEILRIQGATKFNGRSIVQGEAVARGGVVESAPVGVHNNSLSADGRYLTYNDGGTIYQKDLQTSTITTIGGGSVYDKPLKLAVTPLGDAVAFIDGSSIYRWDRLTGITSEIITLASAQTGDSLAISNDGTQVAILTNNSYNSDGSGDIVNPGTAYQHLAVYNSTTGQLWGDDDRVDFNDVNNFGIAMSFSPDGTRIMVLDEDLSYGSSGAGLYDVADLGGGFTIYDGAAQGGNAVVGADNNLYFIAGGDLYKSTTSASTIIARSLGAGTSFVQAIDGGNSIAFLSSANPLGTNSSGMTQLFRASLSGEIRQITNYSTNVLLSTQYAAIAHDGNSVLARSGGIDYRYDTRPQISLGIDTGSGTSGAITADILSLDGAIRGIQSLDISSQRGARLALTVLQDNVGQLDLARGNLGAAVSRFGSARNVLSNSAEQNTAANSRIRDVDVAASIAQSTRLEILADTQSAILAQAARIEPKIALDLLNAATGG